MEHALRLSPVSFLKVMIPQTENKERAKEVVVTTPLLKRVLLAVGSLASMVLGTFLVVFGVLDWKFGLIPQGSLAIFPVRGFATGGLGDLLLIAAGIGFWVLGFLGLNIALRKE